MDDPAAPACPLAEQTVAWVLHTLEPGAEVGVARHLARCSACAALYRATAATTAGLGAAVDQVTPPAGLRDRILEAAEREPRVPPPTDPS